jgi:hypothetical protein
MRDRVSALAEQIVDEATTIIVNGYDKELAISRTASLIMNFTQNVAHDILIKFAEAKDQIIEELNQVKP